MCASEIVDVSGISLPLYLEAYGTFFADYDTLFFISSTSKRVSQRQSIYSVVQHIEKKLAVCFFPECVCPTPIADDSA